MEGSAAGDRIFAAILGPRTLGVVWGKPKGEAVEKMEAGWLPVASGAVSSP